MELDLAPELIAILASDSALFRAQTRADRPDLDDRLASPETRRAMLEWLAAPDREPDVADLIASVLGHLRAGASEDEAPVVRTFVLHDQALVRQRAFEFLLTLYFPDRNRPALLAVLQTMFADDDDQIRTTAARMVERGGLVGDLTGFLGTWQRSAEARGWAASESASRIQQLLEDGNGGPT